MINIATGIRSLSDFKRNTGEIVARLRQCGEPYVLTVHGKASIVVQDAGAYQKLLERLDELEAVEGIKRGLADVKRGRVRTLSAFEKGFRKRHDLPRQAGRRR